MLAQLIPWLIVLAVVFVVFTVFVVIWGIRAHRQQVSAGREDLVGKIAVVDIALEPKGVVLIQGERWTAISNSGRVEPDEEVIITRVDGLKLYVAKKQ